MARELDGMMQLDDGVRLVRVNEQGDTAAIPTKDVSFIQRFVKFMNWLETAMSENQKREIPEQEGNPNFMQELETYLQARTETCAKACEMIDSLFGEGVSQNAFGVATPDEVCIVEFVEQITPYINKAFEERGKKIDLKYNRNRKGGRTQRSKEELIADYREQEQQ